VTVDDGPVMVAGVSVEPGTRRDLAPPASESYTGDRTTLPMAVLNGVDAGPRVFVTAAVHGDELNGISVCRRLLDHVDATELRGQLIVVPIVNVLGAQLNSRYLPDRRDLNRSFPGSRSGSMAARIARLLIDEVIEGSHLGIDLHTATNHRTNHPQVRLDTSDPAALDVAVAFGAPFVLDAKLRPGSLRAAAGDRGVPVLTYEGGGPSRFDPEPVDVAERGILRVLHRLGMVDGAPEPAHAHPMVLHESRWLRAERGGMLELHVQPGQRVDEGDPLWDTVSPLGEERADHVASESGYVIGATTLPLAQPGQAIIHLALPGDRVPSEDDPSEELEDGVDDEELDGPMPL
jgi:uncharacterized protein